MWIKSWRYWVVILLWSSHALAGAQPGRFLRLEWETRSNLRPYHLLPLESQGALVFFRTVEREEDGLALWIFQAYDTELKESWRIEYPLSGRYSHIASVYTDSLIRILFMGRAPGASTEGGVVLEISPLGDYFLPIALDLPDRLNVSHFSFQGGLYIIGGSNRRFDSQVFFLRPDGEATRIEHGMKGESWLDDAIFHAEKAQYCLLFRNRVSRRQTGLVAMAFSSNGQRLWTTQVADDKNRVAVAGRWLSQDENLGVIGAFSIEQRTASFAAQSPITLKASGLFTSTLLNGQQEAIRYFPFNEFTNYFSHLTYNEVSRMRGGRKSQSSLVEFNIILSETKVRADHFVVLAEAYFPKYHYVTRMAYDYYGRAVPTTYTVFDGYQFTNAFVAGFGPDGNKRWDNNFPQKNILTMDLRTRVDLFTDGGDIIMAYLDNGRIGSQVIRGSQVIGPFDYAEVEGADPGKSVLEHHDEDIIPWYDNYLICSGYQKMRSLDSALGERRFVFYLTKVAYR